MAPSLPSFPSAKALRLALLAAAAAGVICLLLATFATVIEIKVGTTTKVPDHDTHLSGWDRHGPALLVIALFAGAMIPMFRVFSSEYLRGMVSSEIGGSGAKRTGPSGPRAQPV